MAEIIKLLLSLFLLFTMNHSVPVGSTDSIPKRGVNGSGNGSGNGNENFCEEQIMDLRAKLNSLEQEVANLTHVIDLKVQGIEDAINRQIENATFLLKIQIEHLWEKVNQSTILPTNMTTPISHNNIVKVSSTNSVISTPLPSQTPSTSNTTDTDPTNATTITQPESNTRNADPTTAPTSQSSNTLLGVVISVFAILIIGLLLYVAYQYRYQVYKLIILCFVNDDLSLDTYLDFIKGRTSSMCFFS